jgi:hypothetical protein
LQSDERWWSAQGFDELPDLDYFLCPAAVPVIANPLLRLNIHADLLHLYLNL